MFHAVFKHRAAGPEGKDGNRAAHKCIKQRDWRFKHDMYEHV